MRDDRDIALMQTAIRLARRGRGWVEPNPCVGCVIACDPADHPSAGPVFSPGALQQLTDSSYGSQIVAFGFHQRFGGPHAEVEAISQLRNHLGEEQLQKLVPKSTMYVTLEPCCHHGKTPPCTDLILKYRPKRVVIGLQDPFSKVAGKGIALLRAAGIEVIVGVCEAEARELLADYCCRLTLGRPFVRAKWAMSLDGKIASASGSSQWISSSASRADVHTLRSQMDGIVAGIGTVLADNPMLNARLPEGQSASRVARRYVLDPDLQTPTTSALAQSARAIPTTILTRANVDPDKQRELVSLGVDIETKFGRTDPVSEHRTAANAFASLDLHAFLAQLGNQSHTNLLLEGGQGVYSAFFSRGLVDELIVYVSPRVIGDGKSPMAGFGVNSIRETDGWHLIASESLGGDIKLIVRRQ